MRYTKLKTLLRSIAKDCHGDERSTRVIDGESDKWIANLKKQERDGIERWLKSLKPAEFSQLCNENEDTEELYALLKAPDGAFALIEG